MRFLIVLVIFLASLSALGQEKPSAVLIDEFGSIQCDEMLARIDNFSNQLNNNPNAKGLVIISGSNEHLIEKLKLEILLTSGAQRPGNDISSRLNVLRGNETDNAMMRFWLVPVGAEGTGHVAKTWDLTIPKGTKPFYFHSDNDQICSYPTLSRYLKEILVANPKLRVNVVLNTTKLSEFRRRIRELRETFVLKNSGRMRFFQVRNPYPDTLTEYWLVP